MKTKLTFLLSFALCACLPDKDKAGTGPAADLPGKGRILLADGSPAAGAKVRFYPVDHAPLPTAAKRAAAAYETRTDAEGRYTVDTLAPGEYNILSELDGAYSYTDSVVVGRSQAPYPSDTLREPGSLTGVIRLQPNHSRRTATVQVLGTNAYVNVDKDGRFTLDRMAQGTYSLRILTTLRDYSPLFAAVRVRSGARDTLGTDLAPDFNGIPVVTGLSAAYDTLDGKARLRWDAADYPFTEEYLVYRSPAGALGAAEIQVGRTRGTDFADSLFSPHDLASTDSAGFEYSVRVKNLSGEVGLRFGSVMVMAVPPRTVTTFSTLEQMDGRATGILDTVTLRLAYENRGRRVRKVEWYAGDGTLLRSKADSQFAGEDRLEIAWPQPGIKEIRAALTDDGGRIRFDTVKVRVLQAPPVATLTGEPIAQAGSAYRIQASASDTAGHIVKLELRVGATGSFVELGAPDTLITLPDSPDSNFTCTLRATDDRGQTGTASLRIHVGPWRIVTKLPFEPSAMAPAGEEVFVFNRTLARTEAYDPATREWYTRRNPRGDVYRLVGFGETLVALTAWNGLKHAELWVSPETGWKIYGESGDFQNSEKTLYETGGGYVWTMTGGYLRILAPGIPARARVLVHRSDPANHIQYSTQPAALKHLGRSLAYAHGRDQDGRDVDWAEVFDTSTGEWRSAAPRMVAGPIHASFVHAGKWHLVGNAGSLEAYDPDADAWTLLTPVPGWNHAFVPSGTRAYAYVHGGRAYLLARKASLVEIWSYDLSAGQWRQEPSMPSLGGAWNVMQTASGKILIVNGPSIYEYVAP